MSQGSFPLHKSGVAEQVRQACREFVTGLHELVSLPRPFVDSSEAVQCGSGIAAELIRVPQMMRPNAAASEAYREAYVHHQQELSRTLKEFRDAAIVAEGLKDDLTPNVRTWMQGHRGGCVVSRASAAFPEGIPGPTQPISAEQRDLLALHGAPTVMWLTGEIPLIHRSIDPERVRNIERELALAGRARYGSMWRDYVAQDAELRTLVPLKMAEATSERLDMLIVSGVSRLLFVASIS